MSVAAWLSGMAAAQVIPCRYEVVTFDGPMCGNGEPAPVFVNGINDTDPPTIVGYWFCPPLGSENGFYWNQKEGLVTLTPPTGYSQVRAEDVNDNMQIVGSMVSGATRGFVYQNGTWTVLPPTQGGNLSDANGNNNENAVFGYRGYPGGQLAFFWEDNRFTDIYPTFGSNSTAVDANDKSQVVGWMGSSQTVSSHAFLYSDGTLNDLGPVPGGVTAVARAINSLGEILITGTVDSLGKAFVWKQGEWNELPAPADCQQAFVRDLNDAGVAIGSACGYPRVWQNGTVRNIADLLPKNADMLPPSTWAINNDGYIAGTAFRTTPPLNLVGVLLVPVFPISGDTECDEDVDVDDLLNVINSWSDAGGFADLNGDGVVDALDLWTVIDNWSVAIQLDAEPFPPATDVTIAGAGRTSPAAPSR
jgi:probable HAF family extracellular repeat protein